MDARCFACTNSNQSQVRRAMATTLVAMTSTDIAHEQCILAKLQSQPKVHWQMWPYHLNEHDISQSSIKHTVLREGCAVDSRWQSSCTHSTQHTSRCHRWHWGLLRSIVFVFSGVTCCMGDAFDGRTMHPRNTNNLKGNYMLSRPPTSTVDALSWIPAATPPSFVGKYIFVQAAATAPAKCGKTKSLIEN